MRSSTFETKSPHSRNSSVGHSILIHGRPKLDTGMSNLINSNVDLFMYLIEGIRFGTWKGLPLTSSCKYQSYFTSINGTILADT